jgi:hypothetical protein
MQRGVRGPVRARTSVLARPRNRKARP